MKKAVLKTILIDYMCELHGKSTEEIEAMKLECEHEIFMAKKNELKELVNEIVDSINYNQYDKVNRS